jgi:phosphate transport system substrate-binding protein
VKGLKIDGVAPTQATIKDKTYSVQRPFLLVTKGQPSKPVVIEFIRFDIGKDRQDILTKNNLISIL